MFVRTKMTTNPFTISPDQTLPEAQEIMIEQGVRRLPVMKNGKLVGVVSREDLEKYTPSKATSFSVGEITYIISKTKVSQIMSKKIITISADALLEEAAIMMRDNDVGFLPVMDGKKLAGIITESDILDSFIELSGFRDEGTRLTVGVIDGPGIMSNISNIIGQHGANITRIAVYRGEDSKTAVAIGINLFDTHEIEESIKDQGFDILYKLQNKPKAD